MPVLSKPPHADPPQETSKRKGWSSTAPREKNTVSDLMQNHNSIPPEKQSNVLLLDLIGTFLETFHDYNLHLASSCTVVQASVVHFVFYVT